MTDDELLEFLRKNSAIHKVVQGNHMVFRIGPANPSDECWREFQMLVARAKAHRGLHVQAHKTSMRSLPGVTEVYDCADITVLPPHR
jgi:hypothetical protein